MTEFKDKKQSGDDRKPVSYVTVESESADQRIDNFLFALLKGVPQTLIYRFLRKGEVRINKGRAKPEQKLCAGDIVRIPPVRLSKRDEPAKAGNSLLSDLESRILYEDRHIIAINKPSGLAVHGGSGIRLGLIEALRQLRPQEKLLELAHRLDRDTSGCIVIVKKRSALISLHEALRAGTVDKRYIALVFGRWPSAKMEINAPLIKSQLASGGRYVRVSAEGKSACTGFTVLRQFTDYTLVEAKPYTGRTHQIRVHAKHAGHSLVGDDKYSEREHNTTATTQGFKRLCLHAASIAFTSPSSGLLLKIEAPLPDDIAEPLQRLR